MSPLASPAFAQDAETAAGAELPTIEVTTTNQQQKYPAARVANPKPAPAAGPAVPSPATAAQEAAAAASDSIPSIATSGSLLGPGGAATGSAQVVSGHDLYTSHVFTANEALRTVPGVVVRDEEGSGMRPNIGIRGMNPTRSTKTLLLEDGLFLTFAPYGDNASYFHPLMDRFASVEVIKGADQLLYGPQTISGAVNYLTPNPPRKPGGFAAATVGNRDYFNGQVYYGGWWGPVGAQIDYVHKEGDGARDNTHHDVDDIGFKGIWQMSEASALILKASAFTEDSHVTYTGITDAEMRNFGIFYNPFTNDTFETERFAASATHNLDVTETLTLASSLYWNSFARDWWRQSSRTTDTQCGNAFRNARLDGIAVDPDACNSRQGRLREFETYGFEQRLTLDFAVTDDIRNTLKTGYRLHREEQRRFQVNSTLNYDTPDPFHLPATATLSENNERSTDAFSVFVQNRLELGDVSIAPAFRFESLENSRVNYIAGNPATGNCATPPCTGSAEYEEFIPGISVGYSPLKDLEIFAGIHEGFAPPRVEDGIGQNGGSIEVSPEKSTNIEVGFRSKPLPGMKLEGTWFRNEFDTLVAVGSIAGGETTYAEGSALFEGIEVFTRVETGPLLRTSWSIYGQAAWTWLPDAEQTSVFQQLTANPATNLLFTPGSAVGNRLPYAPEHTVTARIGYAESSFDAHIEMVYVGAQFADFYNLASGTDHPDGAASINARSGMFGEIDAYTVFNLGMTYTYEPSQTDFYFAVKNLFDEEVIVDRTRGILPGAPRLVHFGMKQKF